MAYSAYTKTTWSDRQVQYPMTFTQSTAVNGGLTLTPNEGTITTAGTALTSAVMNNIESGITGLSTAMTNAQQSKITADNGTAKFYISGTTDFYAQLLALGYGYHTFYAAYTTAGLPTTFDSWGFVFIDASNNGFTQFTNTDSQTYSNMLSGGVWKGVQRTIYSNSLGKQQSITASDFVYTLKGVGDFRMKPSSTDGCFEYQDVKLRFRDGTGIYVQTVGTNSLTQVIASAFSTTSLREIKTNIADMSDTLDVVNGTKVYEYDLIDKLEKGEKYSKKIGLIFDETPESLHGSEESIDLYSMVSTLWKATQELSAKNEALEAKYADLEARLLKLEQKG